MTESKIIYIVTQDCVEDGEVLAPVVTRPLRVHDWDGQPEQEVHRYLASVDM